MIVYTVYLFTVYSFSKQYKYNIMQFVEKL